MRKPSRLVLVLACLAFAAPAWGQSKAEWKFGDVFVAVGNGSYSVFHNNGSTYVGEGNITNGHHPGVTAGCASDATFHLITTDYAVTGLSTGAVDRWTMNADPGATHDVIQTLSIPTGISNPTSAVIDAKGNLYTGTADGKGLIVEYPLSNGVYGAPVTLPLGVAKVNSGTPWIDLSADGTMMYFTNGGKTVSSFPVAGINPTISSSSFGLQNPTFFGLRVVPSGTYANDLLVAAGANIYLLNPTDGSIVKTYSVSVHEKNFEFVTLDPNTSGVTSFWAGNPATNNFYRINLTSGAIEKGPFASSGTLSGICAYGDFHARQAQPVSVGTQAPDVNNNVLFTSPSSGDTTTTLKLTFSPAQPGTTSPTSLSGLTVSGVVSEIDPAAGYSDAIPSSDNFPASGPLACTPDTAAGGQCLVWVLDDNTDPTGTTPPPYSAANYAFSQAGANDNTRLIRDQDSDITWLVSNLDPAGQTRGTSGYSLNEIPASQTPDVACGYSSPVASGATYNFGSAIPFKFSAATSLANCASGKTVTNLKSQFGAPFLLLWQLPGQDVVSAGSLVDDVKVSGKSGLPLIYRASGGAYIVNLKTDSLTPGACYIATTFANQIPAADVKFCLGD